MSDIFDHENDAWGSYDRDDSDSLDYMSNGSRSIDRNFYHSIQKYQKLVHETDKAYLLSLDVKEKFEIWVPKRLVKEIDEKRKTILVHTQTYNSIVDKKLEENRKDNGSEIRKGHRR